MLNFGICLKGDMPIGRMVDLARRAESSGFSYCWVFDSHMLWRDCYPVLGYLAAKTRIVRLGPLVTNPLVRDITETASMHAGLNVISGGRAVMGIGRGDSSRRVLGQKPCTVDHLVETIEKIRSLAHGKKTMHLGREQRLCWANPDYRLPIWVGAYGPKALAAAGRVGDGVVLQIADPELIPWFVSKVKAAAAEAGRDPASVQVMSAAPVFVHEDLAECRRHVKWFPAMVGNHVADIVEKHADQKDIPKAFTDYIKGRKGYDYRQHADKDSAHLDFIPDEIQDRFSVIGDVAAHIEKLRRLQAAGVDQFVIYLMSDDEERTLEIYCKEIIPEINRW